MPEAGGNWLPAVAVQDHPISLFLTGGPESPDTQASFFMLSSMGKDGPIFPVYNSPENLVAKVQGLAVP